MKPGISIGVVDQHSFTRGCIARLIRGLDDSVAVVAFETVGDCLRSSGAVDLILYYAHDGFHDTKDVRLAPVRKLLEIAPVIILAAGDDPELVIEAFESGVRGYIPTASTSADLMIEIIRLIKAGGTFVPPSLHLQRIASNSRRTRSRRKISDCRLPQRE
jgi:DNA-binding NarL/FixJ family response regulator